MIRSIFYRKSNDDAGLAGLLPFGFHVDGVHVMMVPMTIDETLLSPQIESICRRRRSCAGRRQAVLISEGCSNLRAAGARRADGGVYFV
ncbi:hypothetical protein Zmor_024597 [Zophobas morio]|uniref:Uncharacterized protein n=1 Tax=Zophobas morio TaxID=2755281 RepID=A0AA38M8R0_9CUCU|nr:hypothetical protein Zmor_024597 [Zophobas morio]